MTIEGKRNTDREGFVCFNVQRAGTTMAITIEIPFEIESTSANAQLSTRRIVRFPITLLDSTINVPLDVEQIFPTRHTDRFGV